LKKLVLIPNHPKTLCLRTSKTSLAIFNLKTNLHDGRPTNSNKMSLSETYRKHTHREHILSLPDTYVGSIENSTEEHHVVEADKFISKTLNFNPGFYKLIDELLVNSHDHVVRLRQRKSANPVKNITISSDGKTFTIRNDGESIDVEQHPEHGVYIPQLIFGELLTSTNYDKDEKKLVGGKNGYGVKLVNIFSKQFQLTIVDSKRNLKYEQTFQNNMSVIGTPTVKACKTKSYVEIVWTPDFKKFGWEDTIPEPLLQVIQRRVYDLAMTVGKDVKISWNDNHIKFKDLSTYASWYLPEDSTILCDNPQLHWNIAISDSPTDKAFNVSFVNGIWTRSGKHVDEITNQVVNFIVTHIDTKKKTKVKPALVRDSLAVFIHCFVENPSFSSQTKEVMTSKVSCKLNDDFLKKVVAKLNVVEKVLEAQNVKDAKDLKKTDGKKTSKITGIPKLDDAVMAGTSRSHECVLILTEGDSAKAMALSGLSQEQRKLYGVFPLRGKLLNVKDMTSKKIETTEEIANLKKIIGLESGKKYTDVKPLRYGSVLIMTDQDYDGSHIRGLLINLFHELWHQLIQIPGFITYMSTPIVKATKGSKVLSFYSQYEYEEWKKANMNWRVKYYKGLGTSTRDEAKEYFKSMNTVKYMYSGESDKAIELAFNKSMANQRKEWLKSYSRSEIVGSEKQLAYEDFVNKDLIHFSNYNLERSIPNVMDGLKTSQRKILFSALKRNLKSEIRVAQFSGYVSEHSGYHHGEASLNDAIIGMAQDFVGSNNLAWLVPQGQFGTRLQGGNDAASPRYIHTYLQPYIHSLIPSDDLECLKYRDDDGLPVEPEWYAPVLPMLLVNGARGIGTGYSTYIPQCNPHTLHEGLKRWLKKEAKLTDIKLEPWYRGFAGTIEQSGPEFIVRGKWTIDKDTMTITELPVETWTSDYKEWLDKQLTENVIKDYSDTSTDMQVAIKIKLTGNTEHIKILEKSLTSKIKLTNMHAFDSECVINKYETLHEILDEFVVIRLDLYKKRRNHCLEQMRTRLPFHENVVRFIEQQSLENPLPDLRRKTREECDTLLEKQKFVKISDSYDYLMDLPFKSITVTNARKHQADLEALKTKINALEKKTPEELWLDDLETLSFK
jgi:DNA topoisomerase-2